MDFEPASKYCPKCSTKKPASSFGSHKSRSDGLQSYCSACTKQYLAEYHAKHKAKANARSNQRYKDNPELYAAAGAIWREKNRAAESATHRIYYAANRERMKAASAARYAEKGALIRERQAAYLKANPETRRAIDNRMRAKRTAAPGSFTADDVKSLMALQGGKCVACRRDIRKTFHVDHIKALARGGRNDKANLQLLCPTCNKQKHARDSVEFMRTKGFLL